MLGGEYMDKYLEFMNVNKTFYGENGKTDVLKDISFSLHNDEIIAILVPIINFCILFFINYILSSLSTVSGATA